MEILRDRIDKLLEHALFIRLVTAVRSKNRAAVNLLTDHLISHEGFTEHDIMLGMKAANDRAKKWYNVFGSRG